MTNITTVCVCVRAQVSLAAASGRIYSSGELERVFRNLWKTVQMEKMEGVGVKKGEEHLAALTALDRDKWADIYQQHFTTGVNQVSMETIEKVRGLLAKVYVCV